MNIKIEYQKPGIRGTNKYFESHHLIMIHVGNFTLHVWNDLHFRFMRLGKTIFETL